MNCGKTEEESILDIKGLTICYKLIQKEMFYGVEISVKTKDGAEEKESILFTQDYDEAAKMLHILKRNEVTPISLPYIIDDWMS